MAKTRIGSNAIFSGPQKGLSTLGDHSYAYSGGINVDQTGAGITLLEFTTGKEYQLMKFMFGRKDYTSDDIVFQIDLNGNAIGSFPSTSYASPGLQGYDIDLIIPPLSLVRVHGRNLTADTDRLCFALISGKVYA